MKQSVFWIVIIVSVFLLSLSIWAQDELELLETTKFLLQEGKLEEAQKTLEKVYLNLWNKSPMRVDKVALIEEEATSFGTFRKKTSSLFTQGEIILVYGEPKNYTILYEDESYHFFFTADFNLYDSKGNLLGGQENFMSFRNVTQNPVFETFLNFSFNFTGLETGDYLIEAILRDGFSEKSAKFQIPFKLR
ncbi:MAG: hypothetical protein ACUVQZ_02840 [Candidatus Caldatribacteriaceae bacterium]